MIPACRYPSGGFHYFGPAGVKADYRHLTCIVLASSLSGTTALGASRALN